jgi:hypothetical protein
LRFLDFLIRDPVHSVILHEAGVPVTIPAPERYAIHKLIVSERRHTTALSKSYKDLKQASLLIEAMFRHRASPLSEAWEEAWSRGKKWKQALLGGVSNLEPEIQKQLEHAVRKGAMRRRRDPDLLWPTSQLSFSIDATEPHKDGSAK